MVSFVGTRTNDMAESFVSGLDKMKLAMKDFAVTQKVSVDLMKDAWRDMSASFDAMFAAQSNAMGNGSGGGKNNYNDNTIGKLGEEIKLLKEERKEMEQNSEELRKQNEKIAERTRLFKAQTTDLATLRLDKTLRMPTNDMDEAQKKLRMLEILQSRYANTTLLSDKQTRKLADAITNCKKEIERFSVTKPKSMRDIMGMDESSIDAISKKMRALKNIKVDTSTQKGRDEVRKLGEEYQRLNKKMQEFLGKNLLVEKANNGLARSFGYIRNRLVYALTLGAVSNFTKQIYEIRGQYELLERSLGILIDNMRRGSEIFDELNTMALKSPFTLMELATGAKQLLAYNFAEEEVVDTTRRLADISAALGVPMERLVYNLGQIRAQTVLTARDARDFANAGLAIVPMLAKLYTAEKRFGDEIVTTSQVFGMMSEKMVTYGDVMKVINSVTDEGGKFFDFQAKQADTLKVKMANLNLAWNNMLNDIGKEHQDSLELPLKGLKLLFENWRTVAEVVKDLIVLYGLYRARALLVAATNTTLITQNVISGMFQLGKAVGVLVNAWKALSVVVASNPIGAIATVLTAAATAFYFFNDKVDESIEYQERFGTAGAKVITDVESLFDTLQGMSHESSNYTKVMGELNAILDEYNLEVIKESDGLDVLKAKREKAISLIKEETLERKHLNDVQQGRETYSNKASSAKQQLLDDLRNATSGSGFVSANEELRQNAAAITNIIDDIVEQNIMLIANKTGKEYEQGLEKIYNIIQERMRAIGISERTIAATWRDNELFQHENLVQKFIESIKDAKEENDKYTESIDKSYEAERKATENGADFNDRVTQTTAKIMQAANDTDKFASKLQALLKEYGGQNIIDFLVKVRTEVPAWMMQKNLGQLQGLAARFTALAMNAKKAGKETIKVNGGMEMSVQQLLERAATYTAAAEQKAKDVNNRSSANIISAADKALKEYKSSLEVLTIVQNKQKRGEADATLVKEKELAVQEKLNKALKAGVSQEELEKARNGGKSGGKSGRKGNKKDELGDALTKEIQLISDMQKRYKEYQSAGVNANTALTATTNEYEKTLDKTNATLAKFGIKGMVGADLATMDLRDIKKHYEDMLEVASKLGNTKGVEALEKAIAGLNTEITKIDYKRITDGLNNELGKLKDEYELGIELNATPELSQVFADMLGLDESELADLPKDFESVMKRLQSIIDRELGAGKFTLFDNLSKDALDSWLKENNQGGVDDDALAKALNAIREYANKIRVDETKAQVDEWNKLLEKYAEYEYKKTKLQEDYIRERNAAMKRGGDAVIMAAIDNKYKRDVAKLDFEEFQKTSYWVTATGNLSTLTTGALGMLINKIEQYKKTAKNLEPKQIEKINRTLLNLRKQMRTNDPFSAIKNSMDEAKSAAAPFEDEIQTVRDEMNVLIDKFKENGILSQEEAKKLEELTYKFEELRNAAEQVSEVSFMQINTDIGQYLDLAKQVSSSMVSLAESIGDKNLTKAAQAVDDITGNMQAAQKGAESWGGWWGAVIGGLSDGLPKLIKWFDGDNGITNAVHDSEIAVKRLQLSYDELERQIDKSYGAATIGAQRAAIANKQLQLAELERQLSLEKAARKSIKTKKKSLTCKAKSPNYAMK